MQFRGLSSLPSRALFSKPALLCLVPRAVYLAFELRKHRAVYAGSLKHPKRLWDGRQWPSPFKHWVQPRRYCSVERLGAGVRWIDQSTLP